MYHNGEGGTTLCDNLMAANALEGGTCISFFQSCIPLVWELVYKLAVSSALRKTKANLHWQCQLAMLIPPS
jgi:hypothetical protein